MELPTEHSDSSNMDATPKSDDINYGDAGINIDNDDDDDNNNNVASSESSNDNHGLSSADSALPPLSQDEQLQQQPMAMPPAPVLLPANPQLPIPGVTRGVMAGDGGGVAGSSNAAATAAAIQQHQQLLLQQQQQLSSAPPAAAVHPSSTSIPEFLYQLTKMLTDDNREIIEWSNGEYLER